MPMLDRLESIIQKNSLVCVLLIIFVFIAHGIGIFNGYTWDDNYLIPNAERLASGGSISSFFKDIFVERQAGSSDSEGSYYRPLRTLIFVFVTSLPGPHTIYLHSLSILLHALVSFMVFYIAFSITRKRLFPLLGALVFAVHPAATESVAGISNIKEILATLFVLAAVYNLYLLAVSHEPRKKYIALATGASLLGLLSKETALVIPLVSIVMLAVFRRQNRNFFLYGVLPVITVTAVYTITIFYLSPGPEKGEYLLGSPWITLYTTSAAFIKYFKIVLWPAGLSVRHDIEWIVSPWDWHVITAAIFILLLIAIAVYLIKKEDHRALPLVLFILTLFPISNIIPLRGHFMSERYMYMPLSAVCMIGATCFTVYRIKGYILPVMAVLIIALSIRSAVRTVEWKNDTTLFESAVRIAPDSLVVRWNLHRIYTNAGEFQKAGLEYKEMLRINRKIVEKYVYYARKRELEGDHKAAKKIWERAEYSALKNPELLKFVRAQRYGNQ